MEYYEKFITSIFNNIKIMGNFADNIILSFDYGCSKYGYNAEIFYDEKYKVYRCIVYINTLISGIIEYRDPLEMMIYIITHELCHTTQVVNEDLYLIDPEYNNFIEMVADDKAIKFIKSHYDEIEKIVGESFTFRHLYYLQNRIDKYIKERNLNSSLSIVERIANK
jgi:hypothetical protein